MIPPVNTMITATLVVMNLCYSIYCCTSRIEPALDRTPRTDQQIKIAFLTTGCLNIAIAFLGLKERWTTLPDVAHDVLENVYGAGLLISGVCHCVTAARVAKMQWSRVAEMDDVWITEKCTTLVAEDLRASH
ncbi:unnamed protein product [Mycena citricolor]|uniref:Uncharacterized protein n=1 Tax=Mycena citricolor TaxID=2018698 RepID=A0AAD2Q378_9AGAR|nr:unnamed protein product [Mycena citricolor]